MLSMNNLYIFWMTERKDQEKKNNQQQWHECNRIANLYEVAFNLTHFPIDWIKISQTRTSMRWYVTRLEAKSSERKEKECKEVKQRRNCNSKREEKRHLTRLKCILGAHTTLQYPGGKPQWKNEARKRYERCEREVERNALKGIVLWCEYNLEKLETHRHNEGHTKRQ